MDRPIFHLKKTHENRTPAQIAGIADHEWSCGDATLYGILQEGLPQPPAIGCMVYVCERGEPVFSQIVWIPGEEGPPQADAGTCGVALARYARRTAAARLQSGAYELGGVYAEEVCDWAFVLTSAGDACEETPRRAP